MNWQWLHWPEFRIPAAAGDRTVQATLKKLEANLKELNATIESLNERGGDASPTAGPPSPGAESTDVLIGLSQLVWKIRHAMVPFGEPMLGAAPTDGARRAFPPLVRAWELLEANGIKIIDHTGSPYRSGMGVIPVFEKSPDLAEEIIIDTMRPTIYHHDQLVQAGHVVVGTPD